MGLFDKRKKVDMDNMTGTMFVLGLTLSEQSLINSVLDETKHDKILVASTGIITALTLVFISSKFKEFDFWHYSSRLKFNAEHVLIESKLGLVPQIMECYEMTKKFLLEDCTSIAPERLFHELTQKYLDKIFEEDELKKKYFDMAQKDIIKYYETVKVYTSKMKLVL